MNANTKQRELEIKCCEAEAEVESIEFGIGDLENTLAAKRSLLEKAQAKVDELSAALEQLDDEAGS